MYKINNKEHLTSKVEGFINNNGNPIELAKQFDDAMLEIIRGAVSSEDIIGSYIYDIYFTLRETRDLLNEISKITEPIKVILDV